MAVKSLSTPPRILIILKLLTEKPVSVNKIFETFENKNTYVTRETITKYFSTLKAHGATIKKSKGKYYINYPLLNLSFENLKTLANFEKAVEDLGSNQDKQNFTRILNKLCSLLSVEEIETYKKISSELLRKERLCLKISKKYKEKIQTLSNFMNEHTNQIKILFDNKEYTVLPLDFIYGKNSVSILCYDIKKNLNRSFSLDKITKVKNCHKSINTADFSFCTTFKISGRLKDAYILKEDETAQRNDNSIIVTNNKEDKKKLFAAF